MNYEIEKTSKKGDKQNNEDYIHVLETDNTLACILADGLGGLESGEVASQYVVNEIKKELQNEIIFSKDYLSTLIKNAHNGLLEKQSLTHIKKKMCTTIVVLLIKENRAIYAYVGDSRLYHFRNRQIKSITKDHSVCQMLVNVNELEYEQIRFHEDKNKITKVLGQDEGFSITCDELTIYPEKDSFLLCSDGVWENLDTLQFEISYCKSKNIKEFLENIEKTILLQAKKNMDNYSMIGIEIKN